MALKVAVITPYYRTPNTWLWRCHASVRAQQHPCTHILVADGEPQDIVKGFACEHIILPQCHADYGDTPRTIGSLRAIELGYDAIAYLDADNWYRPNHIQSMIASHETTGAAVCTSKRSLHHLDGRLMAICLTADGEEFCDVSCLMLTRPAFDLASVWANIAQDEHAIDDCIMWFNIVSRGLSRTHTNLATVCYTARHAGFYEVLKWPVPDGTHNSDAVARAHANWIARGNPRLPPFGESKMLPLGQELVPESLVGTLTIRITPSGVAIEFMNAHTTGPVLSELIADGPQPGH